MTVPSEFCTLSGYFQSCVDFLRTYSWVYQHANTRFLVAGVLENFDVCEKEYFSKIQLNELNVFPVTNVAIRGEMPRSLQEFRSRLKYLTPLMDTELSHLMSYANTVCESIILKNIGIKKRHEIDRLACIVNMLCDKNEVLIDFGAGHGYLEEMLFKTRSDYLILGIESNMQRVKEARRRQSLSIPESMKSMIYKQLMIHDNSATLIQQYVHELLRLNRRILGQAHCTIIGLHTCADLTIASIRIFLAINSVRRLIIMPCCYHKLYMLPNASFSNFPLSESLKEAVGNGSEPTRLFNRPFLRLACQERLTRWRHLTELDHVRHSKEQWARAVAEAIIDEGELVVKRKGYLHEGILDKNLTFGVLCQAYELKSKFRDETLPWQTHHEIKFQNIISKYPAGPKLAEGLTCLQTSMQNLCENIVLCDHLCYIKELSESKKIRIEPRYIKLLNEELSPRCYVLICEKVSE